MGMSVEKGQQVSIEISMMLTLGCYMFALFWITNRYIDERADRIEKRLETLEGKEKE